MRLEHRSWRVVPRRQGAAPPRLRRDASHSACDDEPWSSRSGRPETAITPIDAGALDGDRKAAAGKHIVGAVDGRSPGLKVGRDAAAPAPCGRCFEKQLDRRALAPSPIGIGGARCRAAPHKTAADPKVLMSMMIGSASFTARARNGRPISKAVASSNARKHQALLPGRSGDVARCRPSLPHLTVRPSRSPAAHRSWPAARRHRPRARRGRRPASAAGTALPPASPTVSIRSRIAGVARGIEHDDVGVGARRPACRPSADRQRLGIAARHLPERRERIELLAVQRDHLVALVHGAQHRIVGAAADIGGGGDPERLFAPAKALVVEQAGAEEQVRGRAEHRHRAGSPTAHPPRGRKDGCSGRTALFAPSRP